jgi:hypothetical protein
MNTCNLSVYLSYAMVIYCVASLYYFIMSRNLGTPFNDSLTQTQQMIKKQSSSARSNLFLQGLILGVIILIISKPFEKCIN